MYLCRCFSIFCTKTNVIKVQNPNVHSLHLILANTKPINESIASANKFLCGAHAQTNKKMPLLIYFNGIIKAQLNDTAIHNCLYNYYNLEECY